MSPSDGTLQSATTVMVETVGLGGGEGCGEGETYVVCEETTDLLTVTVTIKMRGAG